MNLKNTQLGFLILAGGQSRRMGVDKWRLKWGEQTFLERLVDVGRQVAAQTVVSLGSRQTIEPFDFPDVSIVRDSHSGCGPLAGIEAGLRDLAKHRIDLAFVTACDHPEIGPLWVQRLVERIGTHEAIMPRDGDRFFGLTAVYRTSLASTARAMLDSGEYRVQDWIARLDVRAVDLSELQSWGLDLRALNNINTPTAYQDLGKRDRWQKP